MAEITSPAPGASPAVRAVSAEWFRCPNCDAFVYHKRLKRNLGVCPECNHHFRLRLSERLGQLLDPDSFDDLTGARIMTAAGFKAVFIAAAISPPGIEPPLELR